MKGSLLIGLAKAIYFIIIIIIIIIIVVVVIIIIILFFYFLFFHLLSWSIEKVYIWVIAFIAHNPNNTEKAGITYLTSEYSTPFLLFACCCKILAIASLLTWSVSPSMPRIAGYARFGPATSC